MRGTTHLLAGLILAVLLTQQFYYESVILAVILILLGSLFPDIDESSSKLGRYVPFVGFFFKHRTIFHSLLFLVATIIVLSLFLDMVYVWAFSLAFLLHLVLDMLTPAGVHPFWPAKVRLKGFVKVGGILEKLIFVAAIIVFLWLLLG